MPWIKKSEIVTNYNSSSPRQETEISWHETEDYDTIMNAAPDDLIYAEDKDEARLKIDQMLGAIPGLTFISPYDISYLKDSLPEPIENGAEHAVQLAKEYGGKIKAIPYYEYDEEILKYGGVVDKHHHLRYDPKMAQAMINRRIKKAKKAKKEYKYYEEQKSKTIFMYELEALIDILMDSLPYNSYLRPSNRTITVVSIFLVMVCDLYSWNYGKGSYRIFKEYKLIRNKWSKINRGKNKFDKAFIKFMDAEIKMKSPGPKLKLKPRSLYYS